jgi:ribosomal protein S12 methylthiotransferase
MLNLLETITTKVPGIALRTTLIVGYPGEGEAEFRELLGFVKAARFARLGVFGYSQEEGTAAYALGDPIPQAEKERRRAAIMEAQREISRERNEQSIGTRRRVLIDREEGGFLVGRTEHDAPEIDNEVFVTPNGVCAPGDFLDVEITDATEYDLYGRA